MKFPLFRRRDEANALSGPTAQDHAERVLVESFRSLGQVCAKLADLIETQRLSRAGYRQQGKFLERLDGQPPNDSSRKP